MGCIAGWIAGSGKAPDESTIAPMLEALAHRSTGGESYCAAVEHRAGRELVLGATLCDSAARISLALDGAIVNRAELRGALARRGYRLALGSDTELALRAYQHWDKDVVKHLRGAFALALWDGAKERLLLARDRFGEKPLYLHESGGALHFASEMKALLEVPGIGTEIDLAAVWDYLAYRYVPGPRTLIAGIRKLAPGSYALWQFGRLRETQYWSPPDRSPIHRNGSEAQPVEAFIDALDDAVELRMAGDAPAGAFLSGGLDSAAVVALMSRHNSRLSTFSAGFAEDKASELPAAARAAKHFGTSHHEIVLAQRDVIARLPRLVAWRDAPVSRASDVALHLLAAEAARKVKVVLTGEGGDEILGGYRRHAAERFAWAFGCFPTLLGMMRPLLGAFPALRTAAATLRLADWRERCLRWGGVLDRAERDRFSTLKMNGNLLEGINPDPRASRLRRMLYFEQASWLPDNLLERDDRMTMAASLEARAPFLDHRLAEYVSRLPDALRVRGLSTKWILRQAGRRLIGGRSLEPRQAGFRIPVGSLLRGEMRDFLLDHLRGPGSRTRCYYEPRVLDRVLDRHLAGRANHEELLWTLLNLEIWHRTCHRA